MGLCRGSSDTDVEVEALPAPELRQNKSRSELQTQVCRGYQWPCRVELDAMVLSSSGLQQVQCDAAAAPAITWASFWKFEMISISAAFFATEPGLTVIKMFFPLLFLLAV